MTNIHHENESFVSSSTVPNTPFSSSDSVPASNDGDFARLIPANRLARLAFSNVATQLQTYPEFNPHAMLFMHIQSAVVDETSASEAEDRFAIETDPILWSGYYRFNLRIMPSSFLLGWVAGSGRENLDFGGIDFLLTLHKGQHVAGRHGRFKHNESGIFLLHSDGKRIVVDGKEELRKTQRAFTSPITGIEFGDLTYTLAFTDLGGYREQLAEVQREHGRKYEPPAFLDPTPSSTDYVLKKYLIQGAFSQGSTCIVSSGFDIITGSPVAIKKIKQIGNAPKAINEVDVLRAIKPHVRLLLYYATTLVYLFILGSDL